MNRANLLILGGGFGGLSVANELAREESGEFQITIVDRNENFSLGLSKLWVLAGYREKDAERSRSLLVKKGIDFVRCEVFQIDVEKREVRTSSGVLFYDYLVVALGAEPVPALIPGFPEVGFNLYASEDIGQLKGVLSRFQKGVIVIFIGIPYKCPPAPFEGAIIIDEMLRKRNVRGSVDMEIHTPQPIALPIAGKEASEKIAGILRERNIQLFLNSTAEEVDPSSKTVFFTDGTESSFDILIGVPPHRPPQVVVESKLNGDTPWIPVDRYTLQTSYPNVFALGDVAAVSLPGGQTLPKAGIFAELQGMVVARNIAAKVKGLEPKARFDGTGYCFAELAPAKAAYMRGEFFAEPSPSVHLDEPTKETFEMKVAFERERLQRWF